MQKVKHDGGGSVIVCGCFADSRPGGLAVIDGNITSAFYHKKCWKKKKKTPAIVCASNLKCTWDIQKDSKLKKKKKKLKKTKILEWPS